MAFPLNIRHPICTIWPLNIGGTIKFHTGALLNWRSPLRCCSCCQMAFNPLEWSPSILTQAGEWYQQVGRTLLHAVRNGLIKTVRRLLPAKGALPILLIANHVEYFRTLFRLYQLWRRNGE
jgi:hypothetical protein